MSGRIEVADRRPRRVDVGPRPSLSEEAGAGNAARRILVAAPQPFYQDRGTPIALRKVLEAAAELGYDVDLLTFPLGRDVDLPRLRLSRVRNPFGFDRVPVGLSLQKVVLDCFLVRELSSRLRQERYTCVHALEEAAFPAVLLAQRYGIPLLYDMQSSLPEQLARTMVFGMPPVQWAMEALERWLLNQSTVVVSSIGLAEKVRRMAPGTTVREWCFPWSVEDPEPAEVAAVRQRLGVGPQQQLVLYGGNFADYQGLDRLIGAIPRVVEEFPGATFVLVGAEPQVDFAKQPDVDRLVSSGALQLVERQPLHAMTPFHAAADVLVSPRSYGGNLPLKVFDYLAAGRPIVATDIPSHRTILSPERAELVAPEANAIADGILALLRNPSHAGRLAAAARRYAQENLAWPSFVRSVEGIYDEVHRHDARG